MLLRALRLDSCRTGRPYERALDSHPVRHESVATMSPPRKSIQAINQDKPAAHEVFNYDSANRLQPPPNLPQMITHPNLPKGKEQVTMDK